MVPSGFEWWQPSSHPSSCVGCSPVRSSPPVEFDALRCNIREQRCSGRFVCFPAHPMDKPEAKVRRKLSRYITVTRGHAVRPAWPLHLQHTSDGGMQSTQEGQTTHFLKGGVQQCMSHRLRAMVDMPGLMVPGVGRFMSTRPA